MQNKNRLTETMTHPLSMQSKSRDLALRALLKTVVLVSVLLPLSLLPSTGLSSTSLSSTEAHSTEARSMLESPKTQSSPEQSSTTYTEEQLCEVDDQDCLNQGEWNLQLATGLGIQVNPLINGKNTPLILLPYVSYQKGAFFIENLQIGYTFLNQGNHTLSIIGDANADAFYFKDFGHVALYSDNPGNSFTGEPHQAVLDPNKLDRRLSYYKGIEWLVDADNHQWSFTYLDALSSHYNGQEIRARYQFTKKLGHWIINPSVAAHWQSESSNDYYFGLEASEEGSAGLSYDAKSGTNYLFQLNLVNQFSPTASFLVKWRLEKFAETITKSPLVEKSQALTLFAGVLFKF
jgi:MipA family protein